MIDIQKSPSSIIRVSMSEYRGRARVDVRTFYRDDDGEFAPSKQGISLPIARIGDLIDALISLDGIAEGRS